ncbi:dnaJ [Populus alba x Populus x berolinensis]|nr:dnaJ [Populus alba x Populus x berolinensis]
MMMWDEWDDSQTKPQQQQQQRPDQDSCFNFDLLSLLSRPKDYYKILEVDYDATDDAIRSNYIRLALKWHPDKQKDEDSATSRFQEINEAYQDYKLAVCLAFIHGYSSPKIVIPNVLNPMLFCSFSMNSTSAALSVKHSAAPPTRRVGFLGHKPFGSESRSYDVFETSEYDTKGMMHIYDYNISEYLNRYKGLILTCNGLGIRHSIL